jgi:acetyl esterase/lipase
MREQMEQLGSRLPLPRTARGRAARAVAGRGAAAARLLRGHVAVDRPGGDRTVAAELDGTDPWLSAALIEPAARAYAGEAALDDPLVSPLYADLTGLPPMLVHVGGDEILRDDACRLVDRARTVGVDASLGLFEGLWHVFHAFPGFPESRDALREIGAFVRRHAGGGTDPTELAAAA